MRWIRFYIYQQTRCLKADHEGPTWLGACLPSLDMAMPATTLPTAVSSRSASTTAMLLLSITTLSAHRGMSQRGLKHSLSYLSQGRCALLRYMFASGRKLARQQITHWSSKQPVSSVLDRSWTVCPHLTLWRTANGIYQSELKEAQEHRPKIPPGTIDTNLFRTKIFSWLAIY